MVDDPKKEKGRRGMRMWMLRLRDEGYVSFAKKITIKRTAYAVLFYGLFIGRFFFLISLFSPIMRQASN